MKILIPEPNIRYTIELYIENKLYIYITGDGFSNTHYTRKKTKWPSNWYWV